MGEEAGKETFVPVPLGKGKAYGFVPGDAFVPGELVTGNAFTSFTSTSESPE